MPEKLDSGNDRLRLRMREEMGVPQSGGRRYEDGAAV